MNFLAHQYLSGENEKLMVGNFIGDFVKGKSQLQSFESMIIKGIELHRSIDEFTDSHAIVSASKSRLRPKYRHYSGVIVDVFYDHFLARNWQHFHEELLPDFADHVYEVMHIHHDILPEQVKYMLPYMIRGNWLVNYSKIEGIGRALSGMARRTTYESKMEESVFELEEFYTDFEKEFMEFFPQLKAHCENWIQSNK